MTSSLAEGTAVLGSKVDGLIQDLHRMRQEYNDLKQKIKDTECTIKGILLDTADKAKIDLY